MKKNAIIGGVLVAAAAAAVTYFIRRKRLQQVAGQEGEHTGMRKLHKHITNSFHRAKMHANKDLMAHEA
jgi:hypothetical protein